MSNPRLTATLLLFAFLCSVTTSFSQQEQKKPKSSLSSGIDSAASGVGGGGKMSPLAEDGEFLRSISWGIRRASSR